ncbi:MAG: hypothetical protein R2761_16290 [Acidimicrobiales bacterium]
MQIPMSKVIAATVVAVILAAADQLRVEDGLPTDRNGWLVLAGKVLVALFGVGGAGYRVTEKRPSAQLVAAIRAGKV